MPASCRHRPDHFMNSSNHCCNNAVLPVVSQFLRPFTRANLPEFSTFSDVFHRLHNFLSPLGTFDNLLGFDHPLGCFLDFLSKKVTKISPKSRSPALALPRRFEHQASLREEARPSRTITLPPGYPETQCFKAHTWTPVDFWRTLKSLKDPQSSKSS